jgi:hypothetical protein
MQTAQTFNPAPAAASVVAGRSQAPSYDISQGKDTLDLAKDLAKFIKENKLSTQVQGREYVNVEGWQYAGSRLGIVPIVEDILNVSTEAEVKYQAKVTLFDMRSQQTVGAGFAVCSNKESGKKSYQEFAISSMAQTRAIGKAYRNILAWIIRAAGYEPTPAEEMDYQAAPARTGGNTGAPSQVTAMAVARPVPAAAVPVVEAPVAYASARQKEDIIKLLNHPKIEREEKTKVLLNINRYSEERAEARIKQLVGLIETRTGRGVVPESKFFKYTSAPAAVSPTPSADTPAPVTRMLRPGRTPCGTKRSAISANLSKSMKPA